MIDTLNRPSNVASDHHGIYQESPKQQIQDSDNPVDNMIMLVPNQCVILWFPMVRTGPNRGSAHWFEPKAPSVSMVRSGPR